VLSSSSRSKKGGRRPNTYVRTGVRCPGCLGSCSGPTASGIFCEWCRLQTDHGEVTIRKHGEQEDSGGVLAIAVGLAGHWMDV